MVDERLLTLPEVQQRLKVGQTLCEALVRRGELPSVKIGRARRVAASAVDRYIEKLQADQAPDAAATQP